jgi:hypothetical protein
MDKLNRSVERAFVCWFVVLTLLGGCDPHLSHDCDVCRVSNQSESHPQCRREHLKSNGAGSLLGQPEVTSAATARA